MHEIDMNSIQKAVNEGDHQQVLYLASTIYDESILLNNFIIAGEMLILRAMCSAYLGDTGTADEDLNGFSTRMKNKIPLHQYLRGLIIYARFKLSQHEIDMANDILEKIEQQVQGQEDPLLKHEYILLKTEIEMSDGILSDQNNLVCMKNLADYIRNMNLTGMIYGKEFSDTMLFNKKSAVDFLLDYYLERDEFDKYLFWLETAKILSVQDVAKAGTLPWIDLGESLLSRITESEDKFLMALDNYISALQIFNRVQSLSNAGMAGVDIQSGIQEEELRRKGKTLNRLYDLYLTEVENISQYSATNSIARRCSIQPASAIQSILDEKTSVLSYYVGDESLYAAMIKQDRVYMEKFNLSKEDLEKQIQDYISGLPPCCRIINTFSNQREIDFLNTSKKLYNLIIAPLEQDPGLTPHIMICPDKELFAVPFSSLWDGFNHINKKYTFTVFTCLAAAENHLDKVNSGFYAPVADPVILASLVKHLWNSENPAEFNRDQKYPAEALKFLKNKIYLMDNLSNFRIENIMDTVLADREQEAFRLQEIFTEKRKPSAVIISPSALDHRQSLQENISILRIIVNTLLLLGVDIVIFDEEDKNRLGDTEDNFNGPDEEDTPQHLRIRHQNINKHEDWYNIFNGLTFGNLKIPGYSEKIQDPLIMKAGCIFSQKNNILIQPIIEEDILVLGGEDSFLYAINAYSGKVLWKYKTGDWIKDPPLIEEGVIYLGGLDKIIRSLSLYNGKKKWSFETSGWILGTPSIQKNRLYAVSKDNHIYILDKLNGELILSKKMEEKISSPIWLSTGIAVLSTYDKTLHAMSCGNLNKIWDKKTDDNKIENGIINSDSFIYGDNKGNLYSIKLENGKTKWKKALKENVTYISLDSSDNLVILTRSGHLYYLDSNSGRIHWDTALPTSSMQSPAIDTDYIWINTNDGKITALSKTTGSIVHNLEMGKNNFKFLASDKDNLYFFDDVGHVFRLYIGNFSSFSYRQRWTYKGPRERRFQIPVARQHLLGPFEPVENFDEKDSGSEERQAPQTKVENKIVAPLSLIPNRIIIVTTTRALVGIDLDSMKKEWEIELEDKIEHPPVAYKGLLVATDVSGKYYIVDPRGGKITWSKQICRKFTSQAVLDKRLLFVGGDDGVLYCISVVHGDILWKVSVGKNIKARPLITDKSVFVVSDEGRMLKVDINSGRIKWSYNCLDSIVYDPVIFENFIFATALDSCIYCIDRKTGELIWKYVHPKFEFSGPPVIIGNLLFIGVKRGEILAINMRIGTLVRKTMLPHPIVSSPFPFEKNLIVGTLEGEIFSWNPDGNSLDFLNNINDPVYFPILIEKNYLYVIQDDKGLKRFSIKQKIQSAPEQQHAKENADETRQAESQINARRRQPTKYEQQTSKLTDYNDRKKTDFDESILTKILTYSLPITAVIGFAAKMLEKETIFQLSVVTFLITGAIVVIDSLLQENERMKQLVNKFVPQKMLRKFSGSGQTMEKEVTILFQDLYNYTAISEMLTSSEIYKLLEKIDTITNEVVSKNGGQIMSYIGDAQMIAYNAGIDEEHHASTAIKTAIEINKRINELNEELQREWDRRFPFKLKMGFGINTGHALIGFRGGKNKIEPFVIGDTTNTAVRLQKLTREVDYNLLISANTRKRLNGSYGTRDLGLFELKGKKTPIRVYAIQIN